MGNQADERDAYLRAQVEAREEVLANGPPGLVTDRRFLFAWRLADEWTHDALAFEEITRWRQGLHHDERPMIRLEHPGHHRLEWLPAHHCLWVQWGNKTGPVSHDETTFSFASHRDPVFLALMERLESSGAARGTPFIEWLPGTRQERLGEGVSVATYRVVPAHLRVVRNLGLRVRSWDEHLHHGSIHWWIRAGSWSLLAIPAWFVRPWLVVPAIVAVELAWIAGLQWSWHRGRHRCGHSPS